MQILINKLELSQKLYKNSLTILDINGKKYEKVYFLINMSKKI